MEKKMNVKIEHKVSHREWDEVQLTPEQFIKFDVLYHSKNSNDDLPKRYDLYPKFVFDNGSIFVDESWGIDDDGRVSTSSFLSGVMSFAVERGQYIECVHGVEKELGQLISVEFTLYDSMLPVFNHLNRG